MTDTSIVEAALVPVGDPGLLVRTGAAVLVEEALLDDDVEFEYLERVLDVDAVGARFVGVDPGDEGIERLAGAWTAILDGLTRSQSELAGWHVRVVVTDADEYHDHDAFDDDEDDDGPVDEDGEDGEDGDLGLRIELHDEEEDQDEDEFDEDDDLLGESHGELTPDQLAELLVEQIDYQQSVYADADLFRALPLGELLTQEEDVTDPDGRAVAIRQATGLAGCLVQAAVVLVDHLFADLYELETADPDLTPGRAGPEIPETLVLSYLPSHYSGRYDAAFTRHFLVTFADLTRRLTCGWEPPACVAQELGLRILLNHVEVIAESAGVDLDDDWRGHLEGLLFEDLDHELLYDPAFEGIDDDPEGGSSGVTPLPFEEWFRPFDDERSLPPFALPEPPADALGPTAA